MKIMYIDIYRHVGKIKISNSKAKENSLAPKTKDIFIYINITVLLVNKLIL